ncbi:hypothetical protein BH10PLA1_BH10PLA1_21810 [soil metagenome]
MQSLAMLDAIVSPEWEYRYFSFTRRWSPGEAMGSMRNGQGDHYFALFNAAGCWLKGFDHEAPMSPFTSDPPKIAGGVVDGVPSEFRACLTEPAFVIDETTFCIWRRYSDHSWQRGPVTFLAGENDPDGSADLLQYFDGRPQTYRDWAADYYKRDVPLAAVQSIYGHEPLNQALVAHLNAELSLSELSDDADEIGYPQGDGRSAAG